MGLDIWTVGAAAALGWLTTRLVNKDRLGRLKSKHVRAFGEFTSIHRSEEFAVKDWPHDVHGSIGHFTDNFEVASVNQLWEWTASTGHSASFEDSRRTYFDNPLSKDPNAVMDLNLLLLPLVPVQTTDGKLVIDRSVDEDFNNKKWGLLVVGSQNRRATYLPKVFDMPPTTWIEIKTSLRQKANISPKAKVQYFAYKTNLTRLPFRFFITKESFEMYWADSVVRPFLETIISHGRKDVRGTLPPYEFNQDGSYIYMSIDESQYIRNTAVMITLIKASARTKTFRIEMQAWAETYAKNVVVPQITNDEAWATKSPNIKAVTITFLYTLGGYYREMAADLSARFAISIIHQVDVIEPTFALGQAVIAAAPTLAKKHRRFLTNLIQQWPRPEDVFGINWYAQALREVWTFSKDDTLRAQIQEATLSLFQNLENLVLTNMSRILFWETNHLAVVHEAFASMSHMVPCAQSRTWLYVVDILQRERFVTDITQYKFINQSRYSNSTKQLLSRVDITSHVVNGLLMMHTCQF